MVSKLRFVAVNRDVSLWPLTLLLEMIRFQFDFFVHTIGPVAGEWSRGVNRMALDPERYDLVVADAHRRLDCDIGWFSQQLKKLGLYISALNRFVGAVARKDLTRVSNKELKEILSQYREKFFSMYRYGWIPNVLEGIDSRLTARLTDALRPFFGGEKNFSEITALLFAPRHVTTRLYEAHLVFLLARRKANGDALSHHQSQYAWLEFDYDGPGYSCEDLMHRVQAIRNNQSANDPIKEHQEQIQRQRKYMEKIDDRKLRARLRLAQELSYWKAERKDQLYHSYASMDGVIGEIGRRFGFSKKQVKHLLHREMLDLLSGKKISVEMINERMRYCVVLVDRSVRAYLGARAHRLARTMEMHARIEDTAAIVGQCVFAGTVRGRVCIVNAREDIKKMKEGFVLVSEKTNPSLLPAMRCASAIVTDQGGITSHAAIIAREMKKPCIIGTKIATKILKDGDRVEVDATRGTVKKI